MSLTIRQGTDAQRLTITPQSGELIYTTDTGYVYVGDGVTLGGLPVSGNATGNYGNIQVATFLPTYTGNLSSLQGNVGTTGTVFANSVSANNIGATNILADYFIGDGSQLTNINAANVVGTYGNANVAAYLPTYTGDLAGDALTVNTAGIGDIDATIITVGNITANHFIGDGSLLTNINAANLVGSYGNANVAAYMPTYLPTYTGNLSANNVSISNVSVAKLKISSANIALGNGTYANGASGVAIGNGAYANGVNSIAIGTIAGQLNGGANVIAIGYGAGQQAGDNAIAIGTWEAQQGQINENSIALNASSNVLNTYSPGFFVSPVRNDTGNTNAQMFYNDGTGEITWSKVASTVKTPVKVATTTSLSNYQSNGYSYNNGPNNDGVGATMTALPPYNAVSLRVDAIDLVPGDRILVKDEVGTAAGGRQPGLLTGKNGIYTVVDSGSISTPWILMRSDDFNQGADIPDSLIYTETGVTWSGINWRCYNRPGTVFVGTTDITFRLDNAPKFNTGSSSVPGYIGQMRFDDNYLYLCVAANTWKRIPLESF